MLRDYLTDLFPILELGTSAKMLSIVPLLAGGGLYETGAGGSAPKHVQQFLQEDYLRWDSLGEFLALAVSIEDLGTQDRQHARRRPGRGARHRQRQVPRERQVAVARRSVSIDNRGSHFYLAMYWARALADQKKDAVLAAAVRASRRANSSATRARSSPSSTAVQGKPVDIGGYYHPDPEAHGSRRCGRARR